MKKLAPLKNLSTEDWHKMRDKGIGGSDVGVLLGYSKYKTNIELWEEKTGIKKTDFKDNAATIRGKAAEEHILKLWEAFNLDRVKIIKPEYHYCHSEYEWCRANFDSFGIVDGENCVVEIKSAEVKNLNDWWEKVPMTYYLQCLHYLLVSGLEIAWLVAGIRIFGKDDIVIKQYKIERDENEINYLLDKELEFWEKIKNKTKPNLIKNIDI